MAVLTIQVTRYQDFLYFTAFILDEINKLKINLFYNNHRINIIKIPTKKIIRKFKPRIYLFENTDTLIISDAITFFL